jgi:hypothetical protein
VRAACRRKRCFGGTGARIGKQQHDPAADRLCDERLDSSDVGRCSVLSRIERLGCGALFNDHFANNCADHNAAGISVALVRESGLLRERLPRISLAPLDAHYDRHLRHEHELLARNYDRNVYDELVELLNGCGRPELLHLRSHVLYELID